ncbi:curved DNA-binding protein CbpA [Chryseomicrobium aureum]|uniref:DnaJ domain-containing protein n=1 Tax=Chryseomicrobium aureum TaxID=1441723 RepID=UPI00195723C4|nr:DnaJ domain-containing protein [Chryseomicrobium aureum]MBM7706853.1 curved DNA-binding protein CbpA [Chryseomicrobium aureum]
MAGQINYYHLLNISPSSTKDEIYKAYQDRMSTTHSPLEKKLIEKAYEVLSNSKRKEEYDQLFQSETQQQLNENKNVVVRKTTTSSAPFDSGIRKTTWRHKLFFPLLSIVILFVIAIVMLLNENNTIVNDYNSLVDTYENSDVLQEQITQQRENLEELLTQNNDLKAKIEVLESEKGTTNSSEYLSLQIEYDTLLENVAALEDENEELASFNQELINRLENDSTSLIANDNPTVSSSSTTFGLGSTKDEVKAIMGTPDGITIGGNWWNYGISYITFDYHTGLVDGWQNNGELKVE